MATSTLSDEETNHLRAVYLCYRVAPEAVRGRFDRQHPPTQLVNELATEKSNLQKIKGKILKQFQWDQLYPSAGSSSPVSTNFDVTLLICLLRNMNPVILPPPSGFDKLPHSSHATDGAHIARIKHYRNCLAHSTDGKLSKNDFTDLWHDLEVAIIGLGGSHFGNEINHAKTISLDSTLAVILQQLTKYEMQLEELSDNITSNLEKLNDLNTTIEKLSTEQTAIKEDYERRSNDIMEDIRKQELNMLEISRTVEGQMSKFKTDLQEVKTDVATIKMETIPETQRDVEEVKTKVAAMETEIIELHEFKTYVAAMKTETIPETQREKQKNGEDNTSSLGPNTPQPEKRSKLATFGNILKPWKWKWKKKSEEIEKTAVDENIGEKHAYIDKKIGQDTVKQQIKEKRKKLLEKTKNLIKTHTNEKTFVHTNAINGALELVKQKGIVILIGPPGIGKSRIGLELLRQISMDNKRRRSIQLDDISQWQDMSDDMDAVFIDDVFGRTNCSYNDNVHSKLLEMIYTTNQNKNVKVILTLRNNIYHTIATITERHRIFNDQHVFDLSSDENQMTVEEKKSCLMNYLMKNKILETDDIKKENINDDSVLDTASTVYLHKGTLKKILHSDIGTQIGFPESCYLFASHRKFIKQGHNFFCHPTEHLSNEIDNLRLEGDKNKSSMIDFTLLVYILLNGDSVNIYEIDLGTFLTMMKTMYLNPLANIPTSYINDSAKRLSGKYLKINNEGNYCFQHRLISEAVMISYSLTEPRRVIPLLGFDFITEMARPQCYRPGEGEVIFRVPVSCYSLLAQRLLQLLDKVYMEKRYLFVQNLCKSKIITMTDNNILQKIITQYKYQSSRYDFEFIRDHRFSDSYYVYTSYFYLPSALMMFCNIDNNSVYQCLYDSIHNTLTSESDSDVMEVCKDTLMESFIFAVCTLDVKRSTVILKILKDHNIKQDDIPEGFCDNIVDCQGLPGLQLMFSLHDLSHVFNITPLLSHIIWLYNCVTYNIDSMYTINIDDNMKQLITSVIVNNNHDRSLVRNIVGFVCEHGQLDFVKDVCERFDSSLLDVDDMIIKACRGRNTEVIQWLMEKYHGLYNVQRVLNDGYIGGVRIILDKSDHTLLDMKSVMNKVCSSGDTELVKWLCEKFDNNLFDMKTAMNNTSSSGNTELVKWLCEKFDNNLFDMKSAMNNACSNIWRSTELVKWLCKKFDNNAFDMKTAMNNACSSWGGTERIKWLCEKFDNNLFDMKTAMNNACSRGKTELVKWLCEKFDNNLFDRKTVMNNACSSGDTELVKWLCEKFDNNLFDMKTAMNNACSRGTTELVKWLCKKFDNNLFDMKTVMNNACSSGDTELVKWLCEKFDNNLFDMKTAMNNACSRGNTELVKWLCKKFDNNLFDMKTAMNNACSSWNTELVKWLCEKIDNNLFDMKSAIMYAYNNYHSGRLEYLIYDKVRGRSFDYDDDVIDWLFDNFDPDLFDIDSADYTTSRYYHIDQIQFIFYEETL